MKQESIIPKIKQEKRIVKITFELNKDLQDNEVICENCHGTGLAIADNVYGIRGDTTYVGVHFPYKHQSISFCKHCYNGVLRKCPNCGSLRAKNQYECPCGYNRRKREKKWNDGVWAEWEKAEKIPQSEAFNRFECLYIDNLDRYVFDIDDLEYAIDDYMDEADENNRVSDLRVYGTSERSISLDATDIVSSACEDLHEEAYKRCNVDGLQKLLDKWCSEQDETKTYYPYYEVGIVLDRSKTR